MRQPIETAKNQPREINPKDDSFWVILRLDGNGSAPTQAYVSQNFAIPEAERLARNNRGVAFYVARVVAYVVSPAEYQPPVSHHPLT